MSELKTPIIECEQLSFCYAEEAVLEDISFSVSAGEYIGVIGSNGSGKTTLIKIILGLLRPTKGRVKLFGVPLSEFRDWQKVGYIQQNVFRGDMNFPVTVQEIVESGEHTHFFGLRPSHASGCGKVTSALERLDIAHLAKKRIGELSGGERQRVFIARALVSDPKLLVLDEPTIGVDAATEEKFYSFLEDLQRSGMTIIIISHDLEAIAREVKKILCLNHHIISFGEPKNLRSVDFLKDLYGARKQIIQHDQHMTTNNKRQVMTGN